jgi:hypothetical protein
MKFRKGGKVEVLQKAEAPFGSWRPAQIVSGNGHTYLVSYDQRPFDGGIDVERIPRKALRPSPPPPDGPVCWVPGDILEVFDSYSWKVAEVVRLLGQEYYLVRLLGSSLELRVRASNLRIRQLWQDSKWVALPKVQFIPSNYQTCVIFAQASMELCITYARQFTQPCFFLGQKSTMVLEDCFQLLFDNLISTLVNSNNSLTLW